MSVCPALALHPVGLLLHVWPLGPALCWVDPPRGLGAAGVTPGVTPGLWGVLSFWRRRRPAGDLALDVEEQGSSRASAISGRGP